MEAKAVSALRSKRGLRPVEQVAEPQLVGRTPQTTNERRANTMKTYILREPKAVEPQKPVRTRRSAPAPASATTLLGPPAAPANGPVLYLGLDVHTDSLAVSLAPSGCIAMRRYGLIGGTQDDVLRLANKS